MGPLAHGAVLIPYRVENLRILPVLGALSAYLRGSAICLFPSTTLALGGLWRQQYNRRSGLPPGQHKVLIELADPDAVSSPDRR